MLDALGRGINRHPWLVILTWVGLVGLSLAISLGGLFGDRLFDRLSSGAIVVPGEGNDGLQLLARTADAGPVEVLILQGVDPASVATTRALARARTDIEAMPNVLRVEDPWRGRPVPDQVQDFPAYAVAYAGARPFISEDGTSVLMAVTVAPRLPVAQDKEDPEPGTLQAALAQVRERLEQVDDEVPGSRALVGGIDDITAEVIDQVEADLRTGEGVALPVSLGIMVLVFGGFLAAGLPIIGALASIGGALATLMGFSYLIDLDATTVNVVTVLGLGLCIDYGLLLVSRYREEMLQLPGDPALPPTRRQRELALRRTMVSAGRTVTFSGITVAIALSGLLCFQASFLKAIGAAGVSIVVLAMLVALTLVPALLAVVKVRMIRPGLVHRLPVLGRVARSLGDEPGEDGFFARLARLVQRYPLIVVMIVLSVLFVMSLPVLRLSLGAAGPAQLPVDNPERVTFDTLQEQYPYAALPTIQVVVPDQRITSPPQDPHPLVETIAQVPGVIDPILVVVQGDDRRGWVSVINVPMSTSENSGTAYQAVRTLRALEPGYPILVTGNAAVLLDYTQDLRDRTPLAVGIVVLATFVLLFLMTGSVLVPIKALFMNLISLGACIGVLVWIFQDGNLEGLLRFTSAGSVESFIPPLTLAFGFGLAMDYEVFLLARIAEYRRLGYSNDESVVLGLQRSGRIISSAALIVVVVFLGFVAGSLLIIKQTGTALAVAVAIDATLVRMLLVPATMTLLGEWNWWAPPWLRRLHDRFGIAE